MRRRVHGLSAASGECGGVGGEGTDPTAVSQLKHALREMAAELEKLSGGPTSKLAISPLAMSTVQRLLQPCAEEAGAEEAGAVEAGAVEAGAVMAGALEPCTLEPRTERVRAPRLCGKRNVEVKRRPPVSRPGGRQMRRADALLVQRRLTHMERMRALYSLGGSASEEAAPRDQGGDTIGESMVDGHRSAEAALKMPASPQMVEHEAHDANLSTSAPPVPARAVERGSALASSLAPSLASSLAPSLAPSLASPLRVQIESSANTTRRGDESSDECDWDSDDVDDLLGWTKALPSTPADE